MSQPSAGQVHVDGAMKKMSLKAKLAELKTPAEKNRFTAKYHEGLGFRGASGRGATSAEALAYAEVQCFGGSGSGNFGHAGRPGQVGGSGPGAAYSAAKAEARGHLDNIKDTLKEHAMRQSNDPKNWGYTGDLQHASDQLRDTHAVGAPRAGENESRSDSSAAYKSTAKNLHAQISKVESNINKHGTANPSWGQVGDMRAVADHLKGIHSALRGED